MKDVKAPILAWLAYLVVLGASITVTRWAPGALGQVFSLLCALVMASLIMVFFMGLRFADNLLRVFALATLMWLAIMLGLTMMDYVYREIGRSAML